MHTKNKKNKIYTIGVLYILWYESLLVICTINNTSDFHFFFLIFLFILLMLFLVWKQPKLSMFTLLLLVSVSGSEKLFSV